MRYVCPNCKDPEARIIELNRALVEIEVVSWHEVDGEPTPDDYGAWDTITESIELAEGVAPYECKACGKAFDKPLDLEAPAT